MRTGCRCTRCILDVIQKQGFPKSNWFCLLRVPECCLYEISHMHKLSNSQLHNWFQCLFCSSAGCRIQHVLLFSNVWWMLTVPVRKKVPEPTMLCMYSESVQFFPCARSSKPHVVTFFSKGIMLLCSSVALLSQNSYEDDAKYTS